MVSATPTVEAATRIKGRRFRLLKWYDGFPAGTTGLVTAVVFVRGAAAVDIEWDIPVKGRIPQSSILFWSEIERFLVEC